MGTGRMTGVGAVYDVWQPGSAEALTLLELRG